MLVLRGPSCPLWFMNLGSYRRLSAKFFLHHLCRIKVASNLMDEACDPSPWQVEGI
jgi:hypothetical protein